MATQATAIRKIRVTPELIEEAAHLNETWVELSTAIQTHLRIDIEPNISTERQSQGSRAGVKDSGSDLN
jgi:hypothetical protein